MYKKIQPFLLTCESALHAGSGSSLELVDLPIQREGHTGFPKVEASSLKGALREAVEGAGSDDEHFKKVQQVFGYDEDGLSKAVKDHFESDAEFASAMAFKDAQILLFPVKSMRGVFAFATCPAVLSRWKRDMQAAGVKDIPELPQAGQVVLESRLKINPNLDRVVLEEYTFRVKEDERATVLADYIAGKVFGSSDLEYWGNTLRTNFICLDDDSFRDFCEMSTEVVTRIKIENSTGTVKDGALFNEEYVPADAVFYSLALAGPSLAKGSSMDENQVLEFLESNIPPVFQLGGSATIGKGLVRYCPVGA